jgi:hypothetical protein
MFPLDKQSVLVLVLGNREEIAIDQVVRFEQTYAVFRGRVAGTDNEGRAFFVPYEHMCYLRVEKVAPARLRRRSPGRARAPCR